MDGECGARKAGESGDITRLLQAWRRGDGDALDRLMPLVYDEMRRLAGHYMRDERPDHTLQPTALVHEAFLRIAEQQDLDWQGRAHFAAMLATMMRRVLLNHARDRAAGKRGDGIPDLRLDDIAGWWSREPEEALDLEMALRRLSENEPRLARITELRLFGGFDVEETARYLNLSTATVKRDWRLARAFLHRELRGDPP